MVRRCEELTLEFVAIIGFFPGGRRAEAPRRWGAGISAKKFIVAKNCTEVQRFDIGNNVCRIRLLHLLLFLQNTQK
jgi:hypothetical protein